MTKNNVEEEAPLPPTMCSTSFFFNSNQKVLPIFLISFSIFREDSFSFRGALTGGESWPQSGQIIFFHGSSQGIYNQIFISSQDGEIEVGLKGALPIFLLMAKFSPSLPAQQDFAPAKETILKETLASFSSRRKELNPFL